MADPGVPAQGHGGKLASVGPWRQFISNKGWVGDAVFDNLGGVSSATFKVDVPFGKAHEYIAAALGWSKAAGTRIVRTTPMRHPMWPWLHCTRVAGFEGIGPKKDFTGTSATKGPSGDYQGYRAARLTLQFQAVPYQISEDVESPFEWLRYTEIFEKPAAEFIATDVEWKFVTGPTAGKSFKGKRGHLIIKKRIQLVWHQVPVRGYLNDDGRPAKMDAALGRVNSEPFMGCEPGTLLMEAPDAQPHGCPLSPDFIGANPARYFKVTVNMIYFNPPLGTDTNTSDPKKRGHNTAPHPSNGLWYPIAAGGEPQYKSYDFREVFKMNA